MAMHMQAKGEILEKEFDTWNIPSGKKTVKEYFVVSNRRSIILTNDILSGKYMRILCYCAYIRRVAIRFIISI
jgi:hypothetical protein